METISPSTLANVWGVPPQGMHGSTKGMIDNGKALASSRSFGDVLAGPSQSKDPSFSFTKLIVKGYPAILMSDDDIIKLASPFQFTLVGLLDPRHVSIQLSNDLDYNRVFARRPLQTDQATASRLRTSVARILVELDITKKHQKEVWIGSKKTGYLQKVEFKNVHDFCLHCKIHGHAISDCFVAHPQLKKYSKVTKSIVGHEQSEHLLAVEHPKTNDSKFETVLEEPKPDGDDPNLCADDIEIESLDSSLRSEEGDKLDNKEEILGDPLEAGERKELVVEKKVQNVTSSMEANDNVNTSSLKVLENNVGSSLVCVGQEGSPSERNLSKFKQGEKDVELEEREVGTIEVCIPLEEVKDSSISMASPSGREKVVKEGDSSISKKKGKNKKNNITNTPRVTRANNSSTNAKIHLTNLQEKEEAYWRQKILKAEELVKNADMAYLLNSSNDNLTCLNEAKIHLTNLQEKEEAYWRQKASSKFLVEGDRNTAYFHNIANHNLIRRQIHKITSPEGNIIEEPNLIVTSGIDYFSKIFNSNFSPNLNVNFGCIPSLVIDAENEMLSKIASEEEIWNNLKSMNTDSIAGPDDFTNKFFHKCWGIIKEDLINAVVDCFKGSPIPKYFNATSIALIPKSQNINYWNDFQPISLCSVFYKLIAKIIMSRMALILHKIISPEQSGFVKGRSIFDNVLLA
ncbi:hypothetical protein KFK09_001694 [Dendrobium nobile]|uniref:Reverse transcriptase domain-containing protein n=1 Tax=Dendrobium nobile TaxID=94219 RepID=A0A8T3C837_DENNO|nr:hypothetical protein KFK09_001694 [Dendrobium nobile]